ncbi:MAG: Ankyrin [Armatimonadetes bacterium]|nr:Ankyrin [Armatimonadota bacterium]
MMRRCCFLGTGALIAVSIVGGTARATGKAAAKPHSDVPLVEAARHHSSGRVQALLAAGVPDINVRDRFGCTALIEAAAVNDVSVVKLLLKRGADPGVKNNGGVTALIRAAAGGNTDSARALLEAGADVDQRGWEGRTALMAAVDNHINQGFPGAKYPYELTGMARLLVEHGADPDARDARGRTAASIARERGFHATLSLFAKARTTRKKSLGSPRQNRSALRPRGSERR